jgi:hypothetical protein
VIDFLVWQGHSLESVRGMTFRMLDLFAKKANKRVRMMYSTGGGKGKGTPSII